MKVTTIYECEICGNQSEDINSIVVCETQPEPSKNGLKVGDIVTSGNQYGWWGEDNMGWFNPIEERHPHHGESANGEGHIWVKGYPKFVVVDFEIVNKYNSGVHDYNIILFSPSHSNSRIGYKYCYTTFKGHVGAKKVGVITGKELEEIMDQVDEIKKQEVPHLI